MYIVSYHFIPPHLLGHGEFETLRTLGISTMHLSTAGGIAWHALDSLAVSFLFFNPWGKCFFMLGWKLIGPQLQTHILEGERNLVDQWREARESSNKFW